METYPSIDTQVSSEPVYIFDKLDGSNIRAEWSRKAGFTKFGTRTRLLDASDPLFGEAVGLFQEKYAEDLGRIFRDARFERATAFAEYYGPHSFAGFHEREAHTVTLFDVHVYRQGILAPKDYLKLVGDQVEIATLLHHGRFGPDIFNAVRQSTLEGMTFEGVVAKGGRDRRNRPILFKLKSYAWLDRLKGKYGEDSDEYRRLV